MMKPCSQESDPAKCEANRKAMRENMKAEHEACKDKADKRACMTDQYCAKSPNPSECQAKAKERHAKMSKRMDEHQKAAEACTGKRGDELQKCYREQREKSGHHRPGQKGQVPQLPPARTELRAGLRAGLPLVVAVGPVR